MSIPRYALYLTATLTVFLVMGLLLVALAPIIFHYTSLWWFYWTL